MAHIIIIVMMVSTAVTMNATWLMRVGQGLMWGTTRAATGGLSDPQFTVPWRLQGCCKQQTSCPILCVPHCCQQLRLRYVRCFVINVQTQLRSPALQHGSAQLRQLPWAWQSVCRGFLQLSMP
jgi:hypothetical protein